MLFRLSCSENNGNGSNNTYIVYKLDRQIMLNDLIFSKRGFDYAKKGEKKIIPFYYMLISIIY